MFKDVLEAAGRGEKEHWLNDHQGALAYIILCDQLSSKIYRGNKLANSFDHLAFSAAQNILKNSKQFEKYKTYERLFIIRPLVRDNQTEYEERLQELID